MPAQPTEFEQLMLELVNRARSDPSGEIDHLIVSDDPAVGVEDSITDPLRFFGTDIGILRDQVDGVAPVAPLAWNQNLANSADTHSRLMRQFDEQSHNLPGELGLGDRVVDAGYDFSRVAENVFAFTESPVHGHAGFYIDWGSGPTGIQNPPGHRDAILNPTYTEIGIGVISQPDKDAETGPYLVTQHLGTRSNAPIYLTGVVIDDLDNDDFYGFGEGLGGVQVRATGANGTFTTVTYNTGGYSLAVASGTYQVTFSGGELGGSVTKQVTVGSRNVKLDAEVDDLPADTGNSGEPSGSNPDGGNSSGSTGEENTGGADPTPTGPVSRTGNSGANRINGDDGRDIIEGLGGRDMLDGRGGNDSLYGGSDKDVLYGGSGNDFLDGGDGTDTYLGGDGADRFVFSTEGKDVIQDFEAGTDRIDLREWGTQTFSELDLFIQDNGNLQILDTISGDVAILSNRFDIRNTPDDLDAGDFIFSSAVSQNVIGTNGRDFLFGRSGNDVLDGGRETDTYVGGGGSDRFVAGADRKDVVRDFQVNVDKLDISAWGTQGFGELEIIIQDNGNVRVLDLLTEDRVILSNRFDVKITPDDLDAGDFVFAPRENLTLSGGSGRDLLVGRSGNDVLDGGKGGDYYIGSAGRDVFVFGRDATDAIRDFDADDDRIDLRDWGTERFADLNIFRQSNGNIRIEDLNTEDRGAISNRFDTLTEADDLNASHFIFA